MISAKTKTWIRVLSELILLLEIAGCDDLSYEEEIELRKACTFLSSECRKDVLISEDRPARCIVLPHKDVVLYPQMINQYLSKYCYNKTLEEK